MKIIDDDNTKFVKFMRKYYAFKPFRIFVLISTFLSEIMLLIYLMILPIQLAYHSLIKDPDNIAFQNNVDIVVCIFFSYHIFLYFDSNIQKIIKAPNSLPKYRIEKLGKWTRLVTLQLMYDLITWGVSVFMASPQQNTFQQRILELFFFLKVYKLYKFHKRTIYILIGTSVFPTYKIFFTVMATFTTISYLSSTFYAIDYAIYTYGGPLSGYIFLVNMGTEPNLIAKPFWVQLLIVNYWAMGTSSTAAYGDICGQAPQQVIFNIFVLYFANFLYGYYLNNIHSIPKQARRQQLLVLQQFDQFQKYNNLAQDNKKQKQKQLNAELYLKILCSIEYKQKQKADLNRVETAIPGKYIEQIKLQIYKQFFNAEQGRLYKSKGFFSRQQSLPRLARLIKQSVFQKDQNIYLYDEIDQTDLIYIHQGSIDLRFPGELRTIVSAIKQEKQIFGQYCFITNQKRKIQGIALQYVSAYIIKRNDYKNSISLQQSIIFDSMFSRCLDFTQEQIQNQTFKKYNDKLEQNQSCLNISKPSVKVLKIQNLLIKRIIHRNFSKRQNLKSEKLYQKKNTKKSIGTQTQQLKQAIQVEFQYVINF